MYEALGMGGVRSGEHFGTSCETRFSEPVVHVVWREEAEADVMVLGVVPGKETSAVRTRVLARREERLAQVVADRRYATQNMLVPPAQFLRLLISDETDALLSSLWSEQREFYVAITHTGRVRLWRLLDELRATRQKEDFDILWNKRAWQRDSAMRFAMREDGEDVIVACLDLDNFKHVNDTLGHPVGDDALKMYLRIVREELGELGEGYRPGGDEVVVLFGREASASDVERVCEAIRKRVEEEGARGFAQLGTRTPTVTSSWRRCERAVSAEEALKLTDDMLKNAKQRGEKNRVHSL